MRKEEKMFMSESLEGLSILLKEVPRASIILLQYFCYMVYIVLVMFNSNTEDF